MTHTKHLIGRGRLTWNGDERRSYRYGYVWLLNSGDSTSSGNPDIAQMKIATHHIGRMATLIAEVLDTRPSTHIGDIFHGVFPSTPSVGERIVLGTGLLSTKIDRFSTLTVGLEPTDGRNTMWLDIKALYRCHEQTVALTYELSE